MERQPTTNLMSKFWTVEGSLREPTHAQKGICPAGELNPEPCCTLTALTTTPLYNQCMSLLRYIYFYLILPEIKCWNPNITGIMSINTKGFKAWMAAQSETCPTLLSQCTLLLISTKKSIKFLRFDSFHILHLSLKLKPEGINFLKHAGSDRPTRKWWHCKVRMYAQCSDTEVGMLEGGAEQRERLGSHIPRWVSRHNTGYFSLLCKEGEKEEQERKEGVGG